MMENKDEKVIDLTNKTDEELMDFYSKLSENILMLNNLLDENNKEEAVKKYQKIKDKV